MQVQQLVYFAAVARTRHFTQAAELVGVAQPTLSKQIRVLENSLGTALFVRNRGAIELTSAGEALLPHARLPLRRMRPALSAFWEAYTRVRGASAADVHGTLRLSTRFAAVRLLAAALEEAQTLGELSPRVLDLVSLSQKITERPREAAELCGLGAW